MQVCPTILFMILVSTETIVGEYQVMKAPLLSLQLYLISIVE